MEFYFTFSKDGKQPYNGGWVIVEADSEANAREIFHMVFGRGESGYLNCAMVYSEEEFNKTRMWKDGNFGYYCHERIKVERRPVAKYDLLERGKR